MRAVAALLLLAGCFGREKITSHASIGVQLDDAASVRGGELATSSEVRGVGLSARFHATQLQRDEPEVPGLVRTRVGGGADLGLRLSLLGMFSTDHRLERWFDIGVDAAAGGGLVKPSRVEAFGRVWAGGWAVLGIYPGDPYASLVLDVRRVATSDWDNATVFTIGLAYSSRRFDDFYVRD